MKKILFAGHDLKFVDNIIECFDKDNNYQVRKDEWLGHNIHNEDESLELLEWADIIFCEWGLGNAVWYSKNKKEGQKLIVRMHQQERKTNYPFEFKIDNIDRVIAISPYIYEEFNRVCKIPREKMEMIYNSVDCKFYNLKKDDGFEFNIGIMGILPKSKRLDRAIDIIEELCEKDRRYKLFIKGKLPDEVPWINKNDEEKKYYEELFMRIKKSKYKKNIVFDGFGSDTNLWMKKIGYMLSTSEFESFHLAPMEGAASGAYPVVFNWDGVDTIYDERYIVKNTAEAIELIYEINIKDEKIMEYNKEYVQKNYDRDNINKEYKKLIKTL